MIFCPGIFCGDKNGALFALLLFPEVLIINPILFILFNSGGFFVFVFFMKLFLNNSFTLPPCFFNKFELLLLLLILVL